MMMMIMIDQGPKLLWPSVRACPRADSTAGSIGEPDHAKMPLMIIIMMAMMVVITDLKIVILIMEPDHAKMSMMINSCK